MTEMKNSAIELYYRRFHQGFFKNDLDFYKRLKEAVIKEYLNHGFCDLVDLWLLQNEPTDIVAISSVLAAARALNNETDPFLHICSADDKEASTIPVEVLHIDCIDDQRQRYIWSEGQSGEPLKVFSGNFIDLLLRTRNCGKKAHLTELERQNQSQQGNPDKSARAEKTDPTILASHEGRKQFLKELANIERNCTDALQERIAENNLFAREFDQKRNEMVKQINEVQSQILVSISDLINSLNVSKEDLYKNLHEWKGSLYSQEQQPFADLYTDLYRIVNIDNLVTEIIDSIDEDRMKPTVTRLAKLYKTLKYFLTKYEAALPQIGLIPFCPQAGEEFDSVLHIDAVKGEDTDGGVIKGCLIPGVMRTVSGGDEVVNRAAVILNDASETSSCE